MTVVEEKQLWSADRMVAKNSKNKNRAVSNHTWIRLERSESQERNQQYCLNMTSARAQRTWERTARGGESRHFQHIGQQSCLTIGDTQEMENWNEKLKRRWQRRPHSRHPMKPWRNSSWSNWQGNQPSSYGASITFHAASPAELGHLSKNVWGTGSRPQSAMRDSWPSSRRPGRFGAET